MYDQKYENHFKFIDVENRRNVDLCEKCSDDFFKNRGCECLENIDCDPIDHLPKRCLICENINITNYCKAIKGEKNFDFEHKISKNYTMILDQNFDKKC